MILEAPVAFIAATAIGWIAIYLFFRSSNSTKNDVIANQHINMDNLKFRISFLQSDKDALLSSQKNLETVISTLRSENAGLKQKIEELPSRGDEKKNTSEAELRLALSGGNIFIPDQRPDLTGIALDAKIWNLGKPSVATEWNLVIESPGKKAVRAQLSVIPPNLKIGNGKKKTIPRANALDVKTGTVEISTTPIEGVLLFYAQIEKQDILLAETVLTLSVQDIYGKETMIKQRIADWLT